MNKKIISLILVCLCMFGIGCPVHAEEEYTEDEYNNEYEYYDEYYYNEDDNYTEENYEYDDTEYYEENYTEEPTEEISVITEEPSVTEEIGRAHV